MACDGIHQILYVPDMQFHLHKMTTIAFDVFDLLPFDVFVRLPNNFGFCCIEAGARGMKLYKIQIMHLLSSVHLKSIPFLQSSLHVKHSAIQRELILETSEKKAQHIILPLILRNRDINRAIRLYAVPKSDAKRAVHHHQQEGCMHHTKNIYAPYIVVIHLSYARHIFFPVRWS